MQCNPLIDETSMWSELSGQRQKQSGQLCLLLDRPDRCFSKIRTVSGHRKESRQAKSGQTDIRRKLLTKLGHQKEITHNFSINNRTSTGSRQCCPLNFECRLCHRTFKNFVSFQQLIKMRSRYIIFFQKMFMVPIFLKKETDFGPLPSQDRYS